MRAPIGDDCAHRLLCIVPLVIHTPYVGTATINHPTRTFATPYDAALIFLMTSVYRDGLRSSRLIGNHLLCFLVSTRITYTAARVFLTDSALLRRFLKHDVCRRYG